MLIFSDFICDIWVYIILYVVLVKILLVVLDVYVYGWYNWLIVCDIFLYLISIMEFYSVLV